MSRKFLFSWTSSVLSFAVLSLSGCNNSSTTDRSTESRSAGSATAEHDHPTAGPHKGDLVELGNEEYHAEIVYGDGGEVTVYVLDSHAEKAVPIDAAEVVINLTHDGEAEQFKLPAKSDLGDPAGKSSRFSIKVEELADDLRAKGTTAKLVISINGKSYSGKIENNAQKTGASHGHAHGKDDSLVWVREETVSGLTVKLGHHGKLLRAGTQIEPAASITVAGKPVVDARVFNSLIDADGKAVLAKEKATVYEPETAEEPAHYAQGKLSVPAGLKSAIIRFRIETANGQKIDLDLPVIFSPSSGTAAVFRHDSPVINSVEAEAIGGTPREKNLFFVPGGIYTAANANSVLSVRFALAHSTHDDVR